MNLTVKDICSCIEEFAPLSLQESWDNSGLLTGWAGQSVSKALLTIDITEAVVAEAIECGAEMIISHHPAILSGIRKLTGETDIERAIIAAVRNGVSIYSAHTNMDTAQGGVSHRMALKLGLSDVQVLAPQDTSRQVGLGVTGMLPNPLDETKFLQTLKNAFAISVLRHTPLLEKEVRKVALCGGSGSSLLTDAVHSGADAYVTADFKYHQFADAVNNILVADIGHFESEQFTKEIFYEILTKKFPTFALQFSKVKTNPINYL